MHDQLRHFINGEWTMGSGSRLLPVIDPATEDEIGQLPVAEATDVDAALDAAQTGFETWRKVLPVDRCRLLRRFADTMRAQADSIASTMTREQGKPRAEANAEVLAAAELVEWLAEEAKRIYGRIVASRFDNSRVLVTHEPVGPVAAFSPWNFPCMMPARKIAHALAAGCSIVLKPAEETPGTAVHLVRLCQEAGFPDGVVNMVFGDPAAISTRLIASPVIRKVSFTGSVPVGKHLAVLAAQELKPVTLELGGHSPTIVFDDADVERAAELCVKARYRNAGQVCTAPTRFFIQKGAVDAFTRRFVDAAQAISVGNGADSKSQMGPLANQRRLDAMMGLVADATARGAEILCGGSRIGNRGYFFAPTVLSTVSLDADVMRQEPFGPLAPIRVFETLEDVLSEANALPYGLAAYAFTRSHSIAAAVSSGLNTGVIAINGTTVTAPEAPFGGVGDSGLGRECGIEGLLEHSNVKTVTETFG